MAQRRMFAKSIVSSARFLRMPATSRLLYYDLGMAADDDGVVEAFTVMRTNGTSEDDLRVLVSKGFVTVLNEELVSYITDWNTNNQIRKDRYRQSIYTELLVQLGISPAVETIGEPDGNQMETQYRLGKDRLGKESIGEVNIYNSSGGDDARARVREEVRTFLRERCGDPSIYFGVTEDALQTAELFTIALFKQFTTRRPTSSDIANVFFNIWHIEEAQNIAERKVTFPQDRKDLLMYAFEQASNAGNPGDWNYINGILKNLRVRGITTLAQAEDYDFEME